MPIFLFFTYHHFHTKNNIQFSNLNIQPVLHWSTHISQIFSSEFQAQTSLTPNINLLLWSHYSTFTNYRTADITAAVPVFCSILTQLFFTQKLYMLIRSFDQIQSGVYGESDQRAPKSNSEWTHGTANLHPSTFSNTSWYKGYSVVAVHTWGCKMLLKNQ